MLGSHCRGWRTGMPSIERETAAVSSAMPVGEHVSRMSVICDVAETLRPDCRDQKSNEFAAPEIKRKVDDRNSFVRDLPKNTRPISSAKRAYMRWRPAVVHYQCGKRARSNMYVLVVIGHRVGLINHRSGVWHRAEPQQQAVGAPGCSQPVESWGEALNRADGCGCRTGALAW